MAKLRNEFFEIIKYSDTETTLVNDVTLLNILDNPEWEMAGSGWGLAHDWRNFVSKSLKEIWHKLTINERALIYYFTKRQSTLFTETERELISKS